MPLTIDYQNFDSDLRQMRSPEEVLWLHVLLDAVEQAKRGRKSALAWLFDSEQFALLCAALGFNAVAIRERVVPAEFVAWLQQVRKAPAPNVTQKPVKESYYKRRRRMREAIQAATKCSKPQVSPQPAPTVAIPEPVLPAEPSGVRWGAVSAATTFHAALALPDPLWECELARVIESKTLDEWEAFCDRVEIEQAACLQQQMEQQP